MKLKIITSANKKTLFLPHAVEQMSRPERMIAADEVSTAIDCRLLFLLLFML